MRVIETAHPAFKEMNGIEKYQCPYLSWEETDYDILSGHSYYQSVCTNEGNKGERCYNYYLRRCKYIKENEQLKEDNKPKRLENKNVQRITEWRGDHAAIVNHHVNYIDKLAMYEDAEESGKLVLAVHSMWVVDQSRWATCERCGFSFIDVYDMENYDSYCRHCGAVMDGIKSK